MNYPVANEIVLINKALGCDGVLVNKGNLEFALNKARYAKTLVKKASALLYYIAIGHPFLDGNKRTAFITAELFLQMNGKMLNHTKLNENLIERLLYDIVEKRIKETSLEELLKELIE